MFRTFSRRFLPNRLDWICKKAARKGCKKILLGWNRGLGDIPLGLFAIVHRIKSFIPDAEITFLIRKDLEEGFSLFPEVCTLIASDWKRGDPIQMEGLSDAFDLIIPNPKPADWVYWQYGVLTPKLTWNSRYDLNVPHYPRSLALHVHAETNYGFWRNWPEERIREFLQLVTKKTDLHVLLLGMRASPLFSGERVIDLRGKTTLIELLSILKNHCSILIAPDSGILSMVYYLNESFPIRVISLWADPAHGILKQGVASPNPQLIHHPLIAKNRDLSSLSAEEVFACVMR